MTFILTYNPERAFSVTEIHVIEEHVAHLADTYPGRIYFFANTDLDFDNWSEGPECEPCEGCTEDWSAETAVHYIDRDAEMRTHCNLRIGGGTANRVSDMLSGVTCGACKEDYKKRTDARVFEENVERAVRKILLDMGLKPGSDGKVILPPLQFTTEGLTRSERPLHPAETIHNVRYFNEVPTRPSDLR